MPFTDESPLGLMLEVVKAEIPDVRQLNQEVEELSRILAKMIAKGARRTGTRAARSWPRSCSAIRRWPASGEPGRSNRPCRPPR